MFLIVVSDNERIAGQPEAFGASGLTNTAVQRVTYFIYLIIMLFLLFFFLL